MGNANTTKGREFTKFFQARPDTKGHVMMHEHEGRDTTFTLSFDSGGVGSITHLSIDGLRALVAAGTEALAVLDAPVAHPACNEYPLVREEIEAGADRYVHGGDV